MSSNFCVSSNFDKFMEIFLKENSKLNLVSKNDEKYLWEKHIYDSLSIKLFVDKYELKSAKILDIGCGGGFPCVPIAIEFPNFEVIGVDSIRKKINSVNEIKSELCLDNLTAICDRVENLSLKDFDIVVSRAAGDLSKILKYAVPVLKTNGYFIAYKSKKTDEEIEKAKEIINQLSCKITDTINYNLPTEEVYERKLVCIKKL